MNERLDTEARKYIERRRASERAAAAAKKAKEELEEQEGVIHDLMDDLNQPSAVLELGEGFGKVRLTRPKPTVYTRIVDKDVALASIEEAGRTEEMFDFEIRKGPANQWLRECLETGQEIPAGFDYSTTQNLRLTVLDK